MMSRIRGRDTKPEISLRKQLHRMGFRFRLNHAKLPGKPDLVMPKFNAVVFVHGCYWHRHSNCSNATTPSSNVDFWRNKFDENVRRDARVAKALRQEGWRLATIWECALQDDKLTATASLLAKWLKGKEAETEIPHLPEKQ